MTKTPKLKSTKKRVKVKEIPSRAKKLGSKDMRKVKGGTYIHVEPVVGDSGPSKRGR